MSIITHRCECGHIDIEHANSHGMCSFGYCRGLRRRCRRAARLHALRLAIVQTFIGIGEPEPSIVQPGAQFGSSLGGVTKTCGCETCCTTYAEATR